MTDPNPRNYELEPRIVDEFAVLDLDRTLLNTSAIQRLVLEGLARHGVSPERIADAITYVDAQKGNSFFLFDYIENEFSGDVLAAIVEDIMQNDALLDEARQHLLCAGADVLLDALDAQEVPYMILTYGEQRYQDFKIALFRRLVKRTAEELPALVTSTANKSELVAQEWTSGSSDFAEIPAEIMGDTIYARMVVVVDDKNQHLDSPHSRVVGVLVSNTPGETPGIVSTAEVANAVAGGVRLTDIAHLYDEVADALANGEHLADVTYLPVHVADPDDYDELYKQAS